VADAKEVRGQKRPEQATNGPAEQFATSADKGGTERRNGAVAMRSFRTEPTCPKRLVSERDTKPCLRGPWPRCDGGEPPEPPAAA